MKPIGVIELGYCPFCGGEAQLVQHKFFGMSDTFGVRCMACEAQTSQFFEDYSRAVDAWNVRTFRRVKHDEVIFDERDCNH